MEKVYTQYWIDLPKEVREHLVKVFEIPRTGITEIRDQTVVADGHTNIDLEVITKERLAAYVGSPMDTTFSRLWEIAISKVNYELHPPTMSIGEDGVVTDITPVITPRYCLTCASNKGRHFKGCPKFK